MPNKFKGTFEIEIEGKEYTLRPSFDAMVTLVTNAGKSEREIFEAIREEKYTIDMIVNIIHAGIMGEYYASNQKSGKIDKRVLGQLIMMEGVTKFVPVAIQFLMFAIVPYQEAKEAVENMYKGDEGENEDDPEPEKKTVE